MPSKVVRLLKGMRETLGLPNDELNPKAKNDLQNGVMVSLSRLELVREKLKSASKSTDYKTAFDRLISAYEETEQLQFLIEGTIRELFGDWDRQARREINRTLGEKVL